MSAVDYEVDYKNVKKELLADPQAACEYRRLKAGSDFSVMVMKLASSIAEKKGVPAEDIDKEIATKSGLGYERYMAILNDAEDVTLRDVQKIAMALGCDATVVFQPYNKE